MSTENKTKIGIAFDMWTGQMATVWAFRYNAGAAIRYHLRQRLEDGTWEDMTYVGKLSTLESARKYWAKVETAMFRPDKVEEMQAISAVLRELRAAS